MSVRRVTVIVTSARGQRSEEVYEAPPGDKIEGLKFPLRVGRPGGRYEIEIKIEEHEDTVKRDEPRVVGLRCDKCGTLWKSKMRQLLDADGGGYTYEPVGAALPCPLCGSRAFWMPHWVSDTPVRIDTL